jgi:hypothetical protein
VPYEPKQDFARVVVRKAADHTHEAYVQLEQPSEQPHGSQGQIRIEAEGLKFTADSSYPISQLAELIKVIAIAGEGGLV